MKLEARYATPQHKIGFSGINAIERHLPRISRSRLKAKLSRVPTYVYHREAKKPKVYNPFMLYRPRILLQGDLIDLVSRSKYNQGVKYILVVVDAFTRYCWAETLLDKSAEVVLAAFKRILRKTGYFQRFMSDAGKEFLGNNFQKLLKTSKIQYVRGNPHAPHVERLNRSLQSVIFKYMTENETNRWVSVLPAVVAGYNGRHHRIIGMSPKDAENPKNRAQLVANLSRYYDKALQRRKAPKFKVGDVVSMQKDKNVFGKGYTQVFTDELFKIWKVHDNLPIPMYTLVDYDHNFEKASMDELKRNLIHGRFYENELQSAQFDVFKVEKVMRRRVRNGRREVLVKWKGWPSKYNSWEPESNVVSHFRKK